MTIDFWTDANMAEFWGFSKMLLETTAPGVMIWFAIVGVGLVLTIVVKAWRDSSKENSDEEYDYREY